MSTPIFAVGRYFGGKGKEKEGSEECNDNRSCFLGNTIREGWQEIEALCSKIADAEEGRMCGFILSSVSNVCRAKPTQVVRLCCGIQEDYVAVVIHKIDM